MSAELESQIAALRELVEAQAEELGRLRSDLVAVRDEATGRTAPPRPTPAPAIDPVAADPITRRRLLGKAGVAAAAGAVGLAAAARPAAADSGDALVMGETNGARGTTRFCLNFLTPAGASSVLQLYRQDDVFDENQYRGMLIAYSGPRSRNQVGVRAHSTHSNAVHGSADRYVAVVGTATQDAGVLGTSASAEGVVGRGSTGVLGEATTSGGTGVHGTSGAGDGVRGASTGGAGVRGSSRDGVGVIGLSTGSIGISGVSARFAGVRGASTSGPGVQAESQTGDALRAVSVSGDSRGVYAESARWLSVHGKTQNGTGVFGDAVGGVGVSAFATSGLGLAAESRTGATAFKATAGTGVAATLQGASAPLRLVPQTTAGAPTGGSHQRGELLCDSNGALWFCSAGGFPGTWKRLA